MSGAPTTRAVEAAVVRLLEQVEGASLVTSKAEPNPLPWNSASLPYQALVHVKARDTGREEAIGLGGYNRKPYQVVVDCYMPLSDDEGLDTAAEFASLKTRITDLLREHKTLQQTVHSCEEPETMNDDEREAWGLICHYWRLLLRASYDLTYTAT